MAFRDRIGRIAHRAQDATGAENSKHSYYVLMVSMGLAVAGGIALYWYFGVFAGLDEGVPRWVL